MPIVNERRGKIVKISVIVPIYNAESFLEKCIDSILKQTYIGFELILVDDGSWDRSGSICDEFSKKGFAFALLKPCAHPAQSNRAVRMKPAGWSR